MQGIPRGKIEWNLNTVIQVITLGVLVVTGVAVWTNTQRDVDDLLTWKDNHEQLHKERLADVKAIEARNEERFRSLEAESRKVEQLTYRLTVQETSAGNIAKAVDDLRAIVNTQATDLRVMREILQRLDPGPRGPPR